MFHHRSLFPALAAFLLASVMLLATSCHKESEPEVFKLMNATFSCNFSQDLLDIADITVTVKDFTGKTTVHQVSGVNWEYAFSSDALPLSSGIRLSVTLKDGVSLTKDTYQIARSLQCTFKETTNYGQNRWKQEFRISKDTGTAKENVAFQISKLGLIRSFTIMMDANGDLQMKYE